MTLRLFFMRQGETEWSLSGRYGGRADTTLPTVNAPNTVLQVVPEPAGATT